MSENSADVCLRTLVSAGFYWFILTFFVKIVGGLLLARLMGQYCFAGGRWRLLSVVVICRHHLSSSLTLPGAWADGHRRAGRGARKWSGGRHYTAGQYVPIGRHLVTTAFT